MRGRPGPDAEAGTVPLDDRPQSQLLKRHYQRPLSLNRIPVDVGWLPTKLFEDLADGF